MMQNTPHEAYLRMALRLAERGLGATSPNPMVGAVLVKGGLVIGRGWHRRAGGPHAEIEALRDAARRGQNATGATLYVTLEPCCTHGRTPPCTEAIIAAGIRRVVAGATDPNPRHCGKGFSVLRQAKLSVVHGVLASECEQVNAAFNHWIVHRRPLVTVKAAMTLDGKIATAAGESKWITGPKARAAAMDLRLRSDAILVGVNTILLDNPRLTIRGAASVDRKGLRRFVLDANARTPLSAKVVTDEQRALTTIVVSRDAPARAVKALARQATVLKAPSRIGMIDLTWLLARLGAENITSLLVEGGGEVNASFLMQGLGQRVAFFYAPKILGGALSRKAVAGRGAETREKSLALQDTEWRRAGEDWLMSASLKSLAAL